MRLFLASLRKFPPRPATWVTLGITLVFMALIFIAIGASSGQIRSRPGGEAALDTLRFPGAYSSVLSFVLGLGGLMAVAYGAAVAGSEWTWGTLKNAVARGEGRIYYVTVTFLAIALLVGMGLLVAFAFGVVMAVIGASFAGLGTAGMTDSAALLGLPEKLARGWLAIAEEASLGFAIATIARSQLAGVGAGIALYFGETFAAFFLPDIIKYMPFNAASAVIATTGGGGGFGGGGGSIARLDPNAAILVVLLWLVGSMVVAALITERADIGG